MLHKLCPFTCSFAVPQGTTNVQASVTQNKHTQLSQPSFLFLVPRKICIFCLCFLASLRFYNSLQLGIYFYHNTENVSQRLLMMADFMVKSNSFLSLGPLLPCYRLYYLPLCSLLEILLFWGVRDLILACTSIPFFLHSLQRFPVFLPLPDSVFVLLFDFPLLYFLPQRTASSLMAST